MHVSLITCMRNSTDLGIYGLKTLKSGYFINIFWILLSGNNDKSNGVGS